MSKLYDSLQKQLETEYRKEAEDCIKIYNKLKELNGDSVWGTQWQVLTQIAGWIGSNSFKKAAYKPSPIGYIFLNGFINDIYEELVL